MKLFIGIQFLLFTLGMSQPKITVDRNVVDLGNIYQGAVRTIDFVVSNRGSQPLAIKHVQPSCGCTTARPLKNTLEPFESDTLHLQFNSTGFFGKIEKHVSIETDDPKNPVTELLFTGTIISELQPTDKSFRVWAGFFPVKKEVQKVYGFENTTDHEVIVRGCKSSTPGMSAVCTPKKLAPGETIDVTVTFTPLQPVYEQAEFQVLLDSPFQPAVIKRLEYLGRAQ